MARPRTISIPQSLPRPDIFRYQDFRLFLKDWIPFLRSRDSSFSMRTLAAQSGISASGLSMVLCGSRNFSIRTLTKLLPQLQLKKSEEAYFESLVKLGTIESRDARIQEINRMSKLPSFQKRNPNEAQFFQYVGNWYHVAIRELACLPGFQADPDWIRERLNGKVPLQNVKSALSFLIDNGYLKKAPDGSFTASQETLHCEGPVFWAATTEYHKQMFQLATDAIESAPAAERDIEGFTVPLNPERLEAARKIIKRALDEIEALDKTGDAPNDSVYQVELALFPLTRRSKT